MKQGIVKNFLRSHFDKEGGIKDNGFRVQGSGFRVQGSGGRGTCRSLIVYESSARIRNEELGMVVRREK